MSMENGIEERQLVRGVQQQQMAVLLDSGVLDKAAHAGFMPDVAGESLPLVLGSEADGVLFMFIGFRFSVTPESTRQKMVIVGTSTADGFSPNEQAGFSAEDCSVVAGLFRELQQFCATTGSSYNLETGMFSRES
jgi:hypothetical protein